MCFNQQAWNCCCSQQRVLLCWMVFLECILALFLRSNKHNISFLQSQWWTLSQAESGYHGNLCLSHLLLCSFSCCVTVCCSCHSFWCPATWRALSPPLRGVMASPVRSRGCWLLLMRWAGLSVWHISVFIITLLDSCPGGKHCPHRLRELLWESSPPTAVHWRWSSAGLPRLPADGCATFSEWAVWIHQQQQLWEKALKHRLFKIYSLQPSTTVWWAVVLPPTTWGCYIYFLYFTDIWMTIGFYVS